MKKFDKSIAILLGAGAFSFALAGVCLTARTAVAEAATPTENGPVEITCKNYFDKDVKITVEYLDGKYYLADFKKNLYVFDTTNFDTSKGYFDDYHAYLHDKTKQARDIEVFSSTDGKFTDKMAVSLFYNFSEAYDFYNTETVGQDWKGVNGKNDENRTNGYNSTTEYPLYVFAHFNVSDGYKNNASFNRWDEQGFRPSIFMIGDGTGDPNYWSIQHQGAAIDVMAHEYQHGVTRFKGKDLSFSESGALNEAISDIFGMLVRVKAENLSLDNDDVWSQGREGTAKGTPLRDFANPSSVSQYYVSDYDQTHYCNHPGVEHSQGTCDEGYIHYNSTIITHLQYDIYKNAKNKKDFSVDALGKLWMRTLELLPQKADFMDFAQAYLNAAVETGFSEEAIGTMLDTMKENKFEAVHKVTFKTEDGQKIGEYYVQNGGKAQAPKSPAFPNDTESHYKFRNWEDGYEKKLENVTGDVEIVGYFGENVSHTVTFYDAAGKVLKEVTVFDGEKASAPTDPQKEKTDHKRFIFDGWDKDFSRVTEDLEIRPKYKEITFYTVTFTDESGKALGEAQEIDEGNAAVAPEAPAKAKEEGKRFEFKEWSEPFDKVTKDMTIKPVYNTINVYTVQFVGEDGAVISSSEVDEGGSVKAPEAPQKEKTAQYTYTFKEWSESFTDVHSNLTVKPVYEETVNKYTVTYFVDGAEKSAELEYGASLDSILPEGMKGWFTDASCKNAFSGTVTGNLTVYTEKKSNAGLFIGIGVGAGVVVLAGAACAVILIKKKKRS